MRMAGRNFLFVPGPTNVPDRVQRAMMVAMEDHRSSKFPELTRSVLDDLKKVFKTETGSMFVFPSSGTGMWEAALTNTLSPGDKVLASRFGQFSHLWIDMAKRLGFDVQELDVEWGTGVPVEQYEEILRADKEHRIKAVLACHNETATGVTSDIAGVRRALDAAKHPALLAVDTVSSLGSIDFRMDEWGVDLAVSGSQKGLMLPAGMGILGVSQKAIGCMEGAKSRRCYFDLGDMLKANATGYFPYTPSLPMLYGLRESLDIIEEEGLENIFFRHAYLAEGVRAAITQGWGLKLCAKEPKWYSNTVSAIVVPEGFNAAHVIDVAFRRYNLALGAGLSKVAGKVFRIGHLGDLNELMLMGAIAGAEMSMLDIGIQVTPGSGVAAASNYWRTHDPIPKKRVSREEVIYASQQMGSVN
ncbi:MAG TPA: aminotransferase class V-fold PLP-dependent enzyme [Rhodocyclaceae bacterium]|nr:aminotransferase class V-fold PLP-dependent enzyme [Rhodocyclaceae bacterium]HMZ84347.1 aminotransferase class V-fold PLP-dependent enzyme [Rhodocyclaceae bacterium]HNA04398.1 aminotransferase class V-fold PLP-dependent enzyme [Rhodocyclaceae bacterium]HNB77016.1 aminotransferase class V-fold PLP-dependent enzyme [Rhodocyclaceae bacterium]HNC60370.1 aminotransferase class V-fold PLP-dependent enzyme [Rhodocyclaceae bacterium]